MIEDQLTGCVITGAMVELTGDIAVDKISVKPSVTHETFTS